jgi:hypothetical protein
MGFKRVGCLEKVHRGCKAQSSLEYAGASGTRALRQTRPSTSAARTATTSG